MVSNVVDTSVFLERFENENYWICPLIDQSWAELVGLVVRTPDGLIKLDSNLYQIEKQATGEIRIRWMGDPSKQPQEAYAQIAAKPKPSGTVLGIPIPVVTSVGPALLTAATAVLLWYLNAQAGALSADEANKLRAKVAAAEATLTATQNQVEVLSVYKKDQEDLHRLILDDPETSKASYAMGLSHGYRVEVIKRFSEDQPQLRSMLTGIEENYIKETFANISDGSAFTEGKAAGLRGAVEIFSLGETKVLSGQEVLKSLGESK